MQNINTFEKVEEIQIKALCSLFCKVICALIEYNPGNFWNTKSLFVDFGGFEDSFVFALRA